jgi:predicted RNA-binding protein (virulence factor B family)
MIYKNQLFRPVRIGERTEAYVSRITPDARIDLSLQQQGLEQVRDSADELYALLKNNDGELHVNDNTAPERVHEVTGMSKKMFKRSLGMLLKSGRVEITDNGIKLK